MILSKKCGFLKKYVVTSTNSSCLVIPAYFSKKNIDLLPIEKPLHYLATTLIKRKTM